jgi:23S rRNA (pseudouridine1915-N3)-methyltransferase
VNRLQVAKPRNYLVASARCSGCAASYGIPDPVHFKAGLAVKLSCKKAQTEWIDGLKIAILWVGKTRNFHLRNLIQDYWQRLSHFCELSLREVPPVKNEDRSRIVSLESERLLAKVSPADLLVLLDPAGQSLTTEKFAAFLQRHRDSSSKILVFAIGGAEGFSEELRRRANKILSLSPMTFTHEIARGLLLEQIYRAFSILHKLPYHK